MLHGPLASSHIIIILKNIPVTPPQPETHLSDRYITLIKINVYTYIRSDCPERDSALSQFHADAAGDALVLNKWFALQASADLPNLLGKVKELKTHKGEITSPQTLLLFYCSIVIGLL